MESDMRQGQATHEVVLQITTSADSIPGEWDWMTLLDLNAAYEDVTVSKWEINNGYCEKGE
jgi:hypothetical protein